MLVGMVDRAKVFRVREMHSPELVLITDEDRIESPDHRFTTDIGPMNAIIVVKNDDIGVEFTELIDYPDHRRGEPRIHLHRTDCLWIFAVLARMDPINSSGVIR